MPALAGWDWTVEERDIARMAYDFINKNAADSPELAELLPEPLRGQWRERAGDRFLRVKYSGFGGGKFVIYSKKSGASFAGKDAAGVAGNGLATAAYRRACQQAHRSR